MEGDLYNTIQKQGESMSARGIPHANSLPDISFVPSDILIKESASSVALRDKSAFIGAILGGLAVVSWVVIILGVVFSISGIVLSVIGLKSNRSKYARIGLALSVIGFVAAFWYAFAVYQGMVNYNYFTTEFWGIGSK